MIMRSAILCLAAALLLQACGDNTEQTADGGIQTTATRGPVEVTVKAIPEQLEVGKPLTLTIEAVAADGVTVAMPMVTANANGSIGTFFVLSDEARPDIPLPEGQSGRSWTQTLVLDTFEAGDTMIPAIDVSFKDARADLPIDGTISLEALPISVASLIGSDGMEATLREIRGPVEMIDPWPMWLWAIIVAAAIIILVISTILIRGRGLQELESLTPEEQARRDLAALEASELLANRQLQPFYVRLTDILRHYIEGRFGLQAPRTTTPEFLVEIGHSNVLSNPQKQTLDQFLRSADMVKFARHEPSPETGQEALSQARTFVEETAQREQDHQQERAAA